MNLFGDLPGFAGGPIVPAAEPEESVRVPDPVWVEDDEVRGDVRDRSWDELPIARPGHRRTLWGDVEQAAALQGRLEVTEAVLGADPSESGTARVRAQLAYHEIEMHSTVEASTTVTLRIEARP